MFHDRTHLFFPPCPLTLAAAAALLAACSGGGGSDGPDGPPPPTLPLNVGTLSLSDFDPAMVQPPPHPLGSDELSLTQRNEVFLSTPSADWEGGWHYWVENWVQEDTANGHGRVPGTFEPYGAGRQIRAAASGQLDADPSEEIVAVQIVGHGLYVRLHRIDRDEQGTYHWTTLLDVQTPQFEESEVAVDLGDFDGDGLDEIALVLSDRHFGVYGNDSSLEVFDDPDAGLGRMLYFERFSNHAAMRPLAGDVDGDGIDDLVVALEGDSGDPDDHATRVYLGERKATQLTLDEGWKYQNRDSGVWGSRLVLGQFDDDLALELAYAATIGNSSSFWSLRAELFDYVPGSGVVAKPGSLLTESVAGDTDSVPGRSMGVTAVDRFGRGRDEIAMFVRGSSSMELHFLDFDENTESWAREPRATGQSASNFRAGNVAAGDGDGDGAEELYLGAIRGTLNTKWLSYGWMESGENGAFHFEPEHFYYMTGSIQPPIIVPGDHDADGFVVRSTDRIALQVSDPIPLVLLTAPPTKAGISQNANGSGTSYSVGSSSSDAVGVTSTLAWSASVGYEASDLFDLFSASAKATVSGATTKSETQASRTTFVQGFSASWEDDVIVFQANLYRTYEYEILSASDPSLVGSYITLDVPIDANTYKWTVDYYNQVVDPSYRIDASLLPHTIGDPDSYRREADIEGLLASYVGWRTPSELAVGQGTGSNSQTIELATENTTEEQRELTIGAEVEFKAGGATVGASVSATSGSAYSVTTSEFTVYEGVVGDIDLPVDYDAWLYDFGVAVLQPGRLADASNDPVGWESGARPLTVVTFWTDPNGSQY
ncbi:MAG: hypothetical protein AAGA20_17915 [Planctomycetota bacterium]